MSLSSVSIPSIDHKAELVQSSVDLARTWVSEAAKLPTPKASQRLAGLLQDPNGLEFAVGFVDGVIRPEDKSVAAKNLYQLRSLTPKFLPAPLRALIAIGANLAPAFPFIVVPIARKVLRGMVSHLVIDASMGKLGPALRRIRASGAKLNINLLGEAVLGDLEAKRRLNKSAELLARKDVDYISLKVSATTAPHSKWAFNENVIAVIERLTPLYELAMRDGAKKFINLDMEEYHDLDLTVAVFKGLLSKPQFKNLEAGIVLQAYLPDALRAMIDLQQWASSRTLMGGAAIKVRIVKGANLPMEQVDAEMHGWPLATVGSKAEADANYKRVINYALTPERIANVKIGVAGHNLFDLAFAHNLAEVRGVKNGLDVEMLLGMAPNQAEVVRRTYSSLVLYTPVVHPQEFDVAIAYLIRRLEEGASSENFLSNAFQLSDPASFDIERQRFEKSIELMGSEVPIPNRLQDRNFDSAVVPANGFENAADTDPALARNREWAYGIISRSQTSVLGKAEVERVFIDSSEKLNRRISDARNSGKTWASLSAAQRSHKLHQVGVVLERNRGSLIEVAMSETGKTFDQADTEVSEAIDFAHYYAEAALKLEEIDGAVAKPRNVTVVTPPWNFPIAIPAGSALAALAAGSAVVFKPAGQAARCGAYLAQLMNQELPEDVLVSIQLHEDQLGSQLIGHPDVSQLILTGGFETAKLFREINPSLKLFAETSGKNSMIITPNADLDLAAKDLAYSAFGHAGQKCSAASVAILVGSVAKSKRFRRQLVDAVQSLHIAQPSDPMAQVGPVIEQPQGKLLSALTTLERGEKWLLESKSLDDSGKLWSPAIREGVLPGSPSHTVEFFGPHLAIMTARNLSDAIALQNAVDYGLTAGLHSLDAVEINDWLARVQAGNLYVNRGITGAIVQRQPFGGWKRSAIGPTAKAGGPNYLMTLTSFTSRAAKAEVEIKSKQLLQILTLAASSGLSDDELESLHRGVQSDLVAERDYFSKTSDVSGLQSELNIFRYLRSDCELRINSNASDYASWRSLISLAVLGSGTVSAFEFPARLEKPLRKLGLKLRTENDQSWLERVARSTGRFRVVGDIGEVTLGHPLANCEVALYDQEPTEAGLVELLPYFKEQAVTITAHRFGNPVRFISKLIF
ncbi:bifunctional proline dehydrogenase/L-glutamate gamma-semialdehyde dehydrogenase [Aquiluna borgnonia]|uniref:bifunctional proline dehydrogenase/L-glutamate gamma-semialdehyde dehydrogenase n=1 Tax=Aquiluna borgnonia TaxID=2499157 RepID=UPI001FE5D88A|nr:bifunctional proline dehydrogenase/L-glutamate gamma-semialdehyde dehydrogenase [Aquiluna borgnonia]